MASRQEVLKLKAREVFKRLKQRHSDAHIELNYRTPLDLLVATVLSAQCTDVRVNMVTQVLFKKCRKPEDYLALGQDGIEEIIRSTGFFRQKAKSIVRTMQILKDDYQGKVPQEMDLLTTLPGVGRKTANVILGNAFGIPGLPVDTHVTRVSNRIGLTKHSDAVKIEYDLHQLIPEKEWTLFSHTLIFHGRRICTARKPHCSECPVTDQCNFFQAQKD